MKNGGSDQIGPAEDVVLKPGEALCVRNQHFEAMPDAKYTGDGVERRQALLMAITKRVNIRRSASLIIVRHRPSCVRYTGWGRVSVILVDVGFLLFVVSFAPSIFQICP